ncbi:FAD dependent oxidoreductase [Xylariaceae sp. FL0662B]|nr:FAD dependent oxidoreductase [Xylariaceae sp. FL0662B]
MFARAARRRSFLTGAPDLSAAACSFSSTAPARADFTHVVIGGGVIGLATARALQENPRGASSASSSTSTLLLERHGQIGTETSSRNSEVIHGGLYYGPSSLKTRLCVAGRRALYAFCAEHGVRHRRTGKWIVAQDEEEGAALERLHAACRDELDGVPTRWVSRSEAARLEPAVRARAAVLESPETGIVDSHGLMVALQGRLEHAGGLVALRSALVAIEPLPGPGSGSPGARGWRLTVEDGRTGERAPVTTETLVNCAGLGAAAVHNMIAPPARHTRLYYAKGNYFSYGASAPRVSRLVYPVPAPGAGGLGTHLTLDLAGRMRFGPDVEWVETASDVSVSAARLPEALAAIRRYLPDIDERALAPDYAGIRPKLARAGAVGDVGGKGFVDFYIRREPGFEGWVNLLGIESPGLTSSLAIGEYVRDLLYGSQKTVVEEGPTTDE